MKTKKGQLEGKVLLFLIEVHNRFKDGNDAGVTPICFKYNISHYFMTFLLDMEILVLLKGKRTGPATKQWVGESPTINLASLLVTKFNTRKFAEKQKPETTYFKVCLTMVELKQLWEMYQGDCSIATICLYMRIDRDYALECIEAAKWLYEGHLHRLKIERIYNLNPRRKPEHKVVKMFHDDKSGIYNRPPTEYSNRSPYGVASPGM